ncbi:MAG: hypothetical protein GC164_10140 [Phycisphaera sp.]|nr:hypothetical protein [Phycisphaera sp.]
MARAADRDMLVRHNGELAWEKECLVLSVPADKGGALVFRPSGAENRWDLSAFNHLLIDMEAAQGRELKLKVMAKNPGAKDWSDTAISWMYLDEHQRATRAIYLLRKYADRNQHPQLSVFKNMTGLPGGYYTHWLSVDPTHIIEITINITPRPYPQTLRLYTIRPADPVVPAILGEMGTRFFPFIDTYGQYLHETWPGKITGDEDLRKSFAEEEHDLESHPVPSDRDKWGGWKDGPRREATGFFRTEKVNGKWWLVDPDGNLFWSHGVTGVGVGGARTGLVGRENYFTPIDPTDPLAQFGDGKEYDFTAANLFRALGPKWQEQYLDLSHRRLASWGMNTLGMWSQREMMKMGRTPYTVAIHYGYKSLSEKLPDPFEPSFRENVRKSLERHADTAGDPWCIGYFVNNELKWAGPVKASEAAASGPPDMAAKQRFIRQLKNTYADIGDLNKLLGSSFADWDALSQNRDPLDLGPINSDCERFYRQLCEAYFKTCREEVNRLAPNQLYLGCRFNKSDDILMSVANQYCDVISYNLYEWEVRVKHWAGVDKPFISSEFHFAAQDRGMWGLGLRWASSQQERARLYRDYVLGALENPDCVGTHWFQYNSQAFTGRGDGENNQVGLTDIGGRPWPELREALREVGQKMYLYRQDTPDAR